MNGADREVAVWLRRIEDIKRYLEAARDSLSKHHFDDALIMFMHIDQEGAQLRREILPYATRRLNREP